MFGVGVDIAHIPRFQRIVERWGARFLQRAFAPAEISAYSALASPAAKATFLASRWASKEALHKAISHRTGLRLDFTHIEVCRSAGGAPTFKFHDAAQDAVRALLIKPFLSISHDGDYAISYVVILEPTSDVTPALK